MPDSAPPPGTSLPPGERLFEEFPVPSRDEWRAEVERLLKGTTFEKRMLTATPEGITLQPLYLAEDVSGLEHIASLPGFAPFTRGARTLRDPEQPWAIAQEIDASEPAEFNTALRNELAGGASVVHLPLDAATRSGLDPASASATAVGSGGVSVACLQDLTTALNGVDIERIPVYIQAGCSGLFAIGALVALADQQKLPRRQLRGAIAADPLGEFASSGVLPLTLDVAFDELAAGTAWAAEHAPQLGTIWVHGELFSDAGAHAVQELAFVLAAAVDYLRALKQRGLTAAAVAPHLRFSVALGGRFFTEVSKLRAARMLWNRVLQVCGVPAAARGLWLHARTARGNKTVYDPHVNILRATTEILSGAVGGADSLHADPFDAPLGRANDVSRRIARNVQHVICHEAHLNAVADPAGGSYYVEHLTMELARAAWTLFQTVERAGGFAAALRAGFIQTELAAAAAMQAAAVATGRRKIVGTNVYPNPHEAPPAIRTPDFAALRRRRGVHLEQLRSTPAYRDSIAPLAALSEHKLTASAALVDAVIEAVAGGATVGDIHHARPAQHGAEARITPVPLRRIAEPFERLRQAVKAHGKLPVCLAIVGSLSRCMPRLDFAAAFFETGGFAVIRAPGHDAPAAAAAALQTDANIVVICGPDEDYPAAVPVIAGTIKAARPAAIILLAGQAASETLAAAYRAAGVSESIHLRSDRLTILDALAERGGVRQ